VVLVVVDQLPQWSFEPKSKVVTDGIARLLRGGRQWVGRYPFATTATAPGHASLSTGAPPAVSGIMNNEWYRPEVGKELGAARGADGKPSSAWLEVDGLADVLARQRPDARAVAVALKDRSAILALGQTGLPLWYSADCACFVTTGAAPAWLTQLAATRPIAPRLRTPWTPDDPEKLAQLSGLQDDSPGELAIPGWKSTFPHDFQAVSKPTQAAMVAPLGNQVVVEAALAAVEGERMGADDMADLLIVSFSAHDYIGHAFGQESWEAWDAWIKLDRQIGDLLRGLDEKVGPGKWAAVLTSDHGVAELPERRLARGEPGMRLAYEDVARVADEAADAVVGQGDWIVAARYPNIILSEAGKKLPEARRAQVVDAIVGAVRAMKGIQRADRAADFMGNCDQRHGDDRVICMALHPARSGEVFYAPAPGTVLHEAEEVDATMHGSLFAYDQDVPLILMAPGVAPGRAGDPVSMLRVAPTLANLLRITPPPAATESSLLPLSQTAGEP